MDKPGFVPVDQYLALPRSPATWLVRDLIPMSGAGLLYGLPKTGKSAAAIQLAAAMSGGSDDWLGFNVCTHGCVAYLQLDTPRSTWSLRFDALPQAGVKYVKENLWLADRESLSHFPFDILNKQHENYLRDTLKQVKPICVFVDTLRKVHAGDEDNSSQMSNVISALVAATAPAALVIVSHSRKANFERPFDLMSDHRGSGSVTGEMDGVMCMTHNCIKYGGRNIEESEVRLERVDTGNVNLLLWKPYNNADELMRIHKVLNDTKLTSMRAKARALAPQVGKSEEACMSLLRRLNPATITVSGEKRVVVSGSKLVPTGDTPVTDPE